MKSSIIEVIVLSLFAAYNRNLSNLLWLILKFKVFFFILPVQCRYFYASIFTDRLQRNAQSERNARGDKQENFNNENILPIQNKT